jgi:hypothetical protein
LSIGIGEAKQKMRFNIGKIAEVHYFLRPCVLTALKEVILSPEAKEVLKSSSTTYFELWQENYTDRYFDIATFFQLSAQIDLSFKTYYMAWMGYDNFKQLHEDKDATAGVFTSIFPNDKNNLQGLFKNKGIIDLKSLDEFPIMQEFFVHKNLYSHSAGLVTPTYINELKDVCEIDLLADEQFSSLAYPDEEVYWFMPLRGLRKFVEATRQIIEQLPEKK